MASKLPPEFFSGKSHTQPVTSASAQASALPAAPKCKATVVAADVPTGAEALWRVGQAPADVERMPVGRLEFVATAEGFAPKRAVVPAGASWDTGPDGKPRFELAVQLDPAKKAGVVDPWPPGEPGSQVGGNGAPGTVHIVTTPRGAEVWLLVGLGPEARVERLKCDTDVDVLVAGPAGPSESVCTRRPTTREGPTRREPDPRRQALGQMSRLRAPRALARERRA